MHTMSISNRGAASVGLGWPPGFNAKSLLQAMLFLCVGAVAGGCSTPDPGGDLDAYLTNKIDDTDRAQQLDALSEQLGERVAKMATDLQEFDRKLRILNMDYDATTEGFDALFAEAEDIRIRERAAILQTFLKMRAIATPEEWTKLAKLQIKFATSATRAATPL